MADIRREKFNKQGQIARELADLALADIDEALNGYAEVADNVVPIRRPGEIGGVACKPSFDLPPDDAA